MAPPPEAFKIEEFHDLILTTDAETFKRAFNSENIEELEQWNEAVDREAVHQEEYSKAIGANPHTVGGTLLSLIWTELELAHTIWINSCAVIVTMVTAYFVVRCIVKATICTPIKGVGKAIWPILRGLWALIVLIFKGIRLFIRFIVQRIRPERDAEIVQTLNNSPLPTMEEITELEVVDTPSEFYLPRVPPPLPRRGNRTATGPQLPSVIGFSRPPSSQQSVRLEIESPRSMQTFREQSGTPSSVAEPIYHETTYVYDVIQDDKGKKIPRKKLLDSVNRRLDEMFKKNSPSTSSNVEIPLGEIVSSPLL